MCGIAGLIWTDIEKPADTDAVHAMCDAMAHRGPDDAGILTSGPVALGHRRLSILDLSDLGHQPMVSIDGRYAIVFNGEIYNYSELRSELVNRGSRFVSMTDTEVILEAYRHWGDDCVTRFNGMWAFAILDKTKRRLFISRDRLGIKPLYYHKSSDCLIFASEIKGILAAKPGLRRAYTSYVARFVPSGVFDDGPETSFESIWSLPPGYSGVHDLGTTQLRTFSFWSFCPASISTRVRAEDAVNELWSLLQSSVALHMRSDVPVGTCLSGGVDSSALVGLMSRLVAKPVYTFSGLYRDKHCNEETFVDAVHRHNIAAHPCKIRHEPNGDLVEDLRTITWHQDEPTAGPGLYTQFHVMRRASEYVKVILDGQGADELFAGYLFYFATHLEDLARSRTWRGKAAILLTLSSIVWHWGRQTLPGNWASLLFGRRIGDVYQNLRSVIHGLQSPSIPSILHPSMNARTGDFERPSAPKLSSELDSVLYSQVRQSGLPALLHYEDRNSMAHSIEARVPFLDYRIVEFAFGLESSLKIRGSWTKWVLRMAAARVAPKQVAWRRSKLGYPTPMARWLRADSDREQVAEVLFKGPLANRDLVCMSALKEVWCRHQAGEDFSWLLYRVLTTELWYQHFIDAWQPCTSKKFTSTRTMSICRMDDYSESRTVA